MGLGRNSPIDEPYSHGYFYGNAKQQADGTFYTPRDINNVRPPNDPMVGVPAPGHEHDAKKKTLYPEVDHLGMPLPYVSGTDLNVDKQGPREGPNPIFRL